MGVNDCSSNSHGHCAAKLLEVLAANDIQCDDLASICHADTMCLSNILSYHLIHTKELEYRNGRLVISSKSLSHGLSIFQEDGNRSFEDSLKLDTNTDSKRKEGEVCSKSESKSGPEIDCKIDFSIESF